MKKNNKHLGLHIDKETHDKIFYIANYEGRTGSRQIMYLIHRCIAEFEKEHGVIELDEENG